MNFAYALRAESLPGVAGEILWPGRRRSEHIQTAFYQLANFPVAAVQEIPSLAHAENRLLSRARSIVKITPGTSARVDNSEYSEARNIGIPLTEY